MENSTETGENDWKGTTSSVMLLQSNDLSVFLSPRIEAIEAHCLSSARVHTLTKSSQCMA